MNNTNLSINELDEICKVLSENAQSNEDIKLIREYTDENKNESKEENAKTNKTTDSTLFDDTIKPNTDESEIIKNVISNNNDSNISDEDIAKIIKCIDIYKNDMDGNPSLYKYLPSFFKDIVDKEVATEFSEESNNNISISIIRDSISKIVIEQLYEEIYKDNGVDIDDVVGNTLMIPSITDMYQDSIMDEFESKIPDTINSLEEDCNTDPDKSCSKKIVCSVMDNFRNGYDYHKTWHDYNNVSRIRKMVRRDYSKWRKFADTINFINRDTEFRMPNAKNCGDIVIDKILKYDNSISLEDVEKFLTLAFFSMQFYRENNVENASYCYYILKDMTILKYSNEAKESFSNELMNNIISIIHCIRVKEVNNKNGKKK